MKVLVVEDDSNLSKSLKVQIENSKGNPEFEVTCAESLETALATLAETGFDVALLDLALPDAWGADTVLQIHERLPLLPIVVLTGSQDPGFGEKALRAGAQDFLMKASFEPEELVRRLRLAIERHRRLVAAIQATQAGVSDASELGALERLSRASTSSAARASVAVHSTTGYRPYSRTSHGAIWTSWSSVWSNAPTATTTTSLITWRRSLRSWDGCAAAPEM